MKPNRANRRQKRIAQRRRASRRVARVTHPAAAGIAIDTEDLPDGWRLAVLRHDHRDERVRGREDEAAEYVRGLPGPYRCPACGTTPNLLLVGVLDSPGLDQLGLRCLACRNGPHGLYADLALLGTREAITTDVLRMSVQWIAQRVSADMETTANDADWFKRNKGRQTRLRQPMNELERGTCAPPAPGMQLLVLVRRDDGAWRTPESMWVPAGMLRLDVEDMPSFVDSIGCEFLDAIHESLFDLAREKPGVVEYGEIAHRAMERVHANRQAAEAARAAARPREEGGAA